MKAGWHHRLYAVGVLLLPMVQTACVSQNPPRQSSVDDKPLFWYVDCWTAEDCARPLREKKYGIYEVTSSGSVRQLNDVGPVSRSILPTDKFNEFLFWSQDGTKLRYDATTGLARPEIAEAGNEDGLLSPDGTSQLISEEGSDPTRFALYIQRKGKKRFLTNLQTIRKHLATISKSAVILTSGWSHDSKFVWIAVPGTRKVSKSGDLVEDVLVAVNAHTGKVTILGNAFQAVWLANGLIAISGYANNLREQASSSSSNVPRTYTEIVDINGNSTGRPMLGYITVGYCRNSHSVILLSATGIAGKDAFLQLASNDLQPFGKKYPLMEYQIWEEVGGTDSIAVGF